LPRSRIAFREQSAYSTPPTLQSSNLTRLIRASSKALTTSERCPAFLLHLAARRRVRQQAPQRASNLSQSLTAQQKPRTSSRGEHRVSVQLAAQHALQ